MEYTVSPLGDESVVIQLSESISVETQTHIEAIAVYLDNHPISGMVEYIPAYTTIAIFSNAVDVLAENHSDGTNAFDVVQREIETTVSQFTEHPATGDNDNRVPV